MIRDQSGAMASRPAAAAGTTLAVDASSMAATWPFSAALTSGTPFRSVASVPLRTDNGPPFGALDLYNVDPEAPTLDGVIGDAAQVGQLSSGLPGRYRRVSPSLPPGQTGRIGPVSYVLSDRR